MLPDVLVKNLKVVFCGTAVGNVSAQRQAYYSGPGNKFWRVLFETGLTTRLLLPRESVFLVEFGIGLTDLVKGRSGVDAELFQSDFDIHTFKDKINFYEPNLVCFNGKMASKTFFNSAIVDYGVSEYQLGITKFYTLPSTSGAANRYWDISFWEEVAKII